MVNWNAVGAVAEGLGAIVVVVSVIYLALQVKQANLQAQGTAHADWLTTWNDTIKGWITDRDTIQVLQRGFADFDALSHVDQAIFAQHVAALINHWHLAADLFDRGPLDESLHRGANEVVLSVCSTQGGAHFLKTNAGAFPRGTQLLRMLESGEGSLPPFNVLAPWGGCYCGRTRLWSHSERFWRPGRRLCSRSAFGASRLAWYASGLHVAA